jgi:hypothetical protein
MSCRKEMFTPKAKRKHQKKKKDQFSKKPNIRRAAQAQWPAGKKSLHLLASL